jgi:hypothetical protein
MSVLAEQTISLFNHINQITLLRHWTSKLILHLLPKTEDMRSCLRSLGMNDYKTSPSAPADRLPTMGDNGAFRYVANIVWDNKARTFLS